MQCSWDAALLRCAEQLPPELIEVLSSSSNEQYLAAITRTTLDARYTDILLAHCEPIFAHVCASLRQHAPAAASLATLGRIVPLAPQFTLYATRLLQAETNLLQQGLDSDELLVCLLAYYRLLKCNRRTFRDHVQASDVSPLLLNRNKAIVYMAIRILQILLDGADHWFERMVERHVGADSPDTPLEGLWDNRTIDYRFLSMWEESRITRYAELFSSIHSTPQSQSTNVRTLPEGSFDSSTTLVGNRLFPTLAGTPENISSSLVVVTPTVQQNLNTIADALKSSQPILMTGLAGCGKTLLTELVATRLGKVDGMVTLHINEQSDAKLLIGIYTTGDTPGSFIWRPGVLTTAVQEGRWLLIEDLDRAPNDILGTLLPLIERRELSIPSRKQVIHAAEGFRIIATARASVNHRGEEVRPLASMVGARHWTEIALKAPSSNDLREIAEHHFPNLRDHLTRYIAVYERLQATKQHAVLAGRSKAGILRSISSREFLKWCSRVQGLLKEKSSFSSSDLDAIFMEAVDCFVGALPDGEARRYMTAIIAEELHIDPQRRDFLLNERDVRYEVNSSGIVAGRYNLSRTVVLDSPKRQRSTFATNAHTCRMLERAAAAVANREPLLLVGETGVGKTTAVQQLASDLGKKLEVFNLSQQSEAGDLLGGFKPVTPRGMMVPLKDEFDDLFQASFSRSKNQQFIDLLNKQTAKGNWKAVCRLWQQALKMVDQHRRESPARDGEAPSKKRRLDEKKTFDFPRWDDFASKVSDVESRLQATGNSFPFTFMEGNIVKAVRNGDWILLDEINLASPDTLESVVDLLDPRGASLMLTEAGNVDRVKAHAGFRVFAAMNPATDVGKKDLPPGIRSRFTELYVESPDRDLKSLQSIVRSYLRSDTSAGPSVTLDVSRLYQKILNLAHTNKLVDGSGQAPHFSLRTLTRTLAYAKHIAPQCNLRRALYEGFQMSFQTFLDEESASAVEPLLIEHIFSKKSNLRAELHKALRKPEDGHSYVQGHPASKHWVRRGPLPLHDQPHYILTPFIQKNMENLVRGASTRRFPVLIQGPTSSGKTSMIEYLARRTGHRFVRINNHEHTDLQEYLGTYVSSSDGKLVFQEGLLVKALRQGHWIVLDELNLAPTDVLEALNRLLDDNRELLIPETQETVRPHEDFMLFATQNPAGLYGGRKTLSRAFRNRFLELHFDDIPIDELQEILHRRTQLPESRCKRIVAVYRELSVLRQEARMFESRSFATLRDLFRWALRPNDTIEDLAANGFMLLAERVRSAEERETLKAIIEKAMSSKGPRVKIDEASLYGSSSKEIHQYGPTGSQDVVWTKAMRRLYVLVARAIANNEPVLLVGETGCGKTTVCQMLADAIGKQLHTVNAHQNTETGDLIGSQRPVRNRGMIETDLRHLLLSAPAFASAQALQDQSTQALIDEYDRALAGLDEQDLKAYRSSPSHTEIERQRARFNALFEWVDGSLVQAMKEGTFFLLDEISLADDSVLERLNSVLESERSMLLAEKGSIDAFVKAQSGFQFFATMNPGGDYGKRELSPALRNRFTEIWVPALSDQDDMIQIVEAKLTYKAKPAARVLVAFAQWFRDAYNTSASSAVSLRDLLAWAQFINVSNDLDLAAACIHGASMVYIDTLGANPAGLMALTGRPLKEERASCIAQLSKLMRIDASSIASMPMDITVSESKLAIGPFAAPRRASQSSDSVLFTFDSQTSRLNAMRVLRAMQLSKPVMLEGSPGVGKTALITAIAKILHVPLVRINLSEQTDMMDLLGSDTPVEGASSGTFSWRDAPFLRAMKQGDWVLLDEMNLASQSILEGLNACLDHRGEVYIPELGQTFTKHPDFRLFAAQNPHHQGGGRKGLPASFVNRFTVVYAESFDTSDFSVICEQMFPHVDKHIIDRIAGFVATLEQRISQRGTLAGNGGPWEFNLRDISRWLSLLNHAGGLLDAASPTDLVGMLFLQRFRSTRDCEHAEDIFRAEYPDAGEITSLTSTISSQHLQLGLALLARHPWTASVCTSKKWQAGCPAHLRALQTVMICVQQQWPVVLTGPSGAGKTALLENLATAVGSPLTTISINADTDAMDLIGGYEQSDHWRSLAQSCQALLGQLEVSLKETLLNRAENPRLFAIVSRLERVGATSSKADLEELSSVLRDIPSAEARAVVDAINESMHSIDQGRFEWTDGLLIEALEHGKWVVLDNANLCSGAVLDRLNSLLEPNGTLIVNEKSNPDGSPRCVRPHANFRVFLTVDPRYGELSRAIRNRSVELFMAPPDEEKTTPLLQPLMAESRMARFSSIAVLSQMQSDESTSSTAGLIALEHSAFVDRSLATRFNHQVDLGLTNPPCGSHVVRLPLDMAVADVSRTQELYSAAVDLAQVRADFVNAQTLHPLNNPAIVQLSPSILQQATFLSLLWDVSAAWENLLVTLRSAATNTRMQQKLSRMERAIVPKTGDTKGLADSGGLLYGLNRALKETLHDLSALDGLSISNLPMFRSRFAQVSRMVICFVDALQRPNFDAAILEAWAYLVSDTMRRYSHEDNGMESSLRPLAELFSQLCVTRQTLRGIGATPLWRVFRPETCSSIEQLDHLLRFEQVVERFDEMCRQSELPLETMTDLRASFARVFEEAVHGQQDVQQLTTHLEQLLPPPAAPSEAMTSPSGPHFRSVFEELSCRLAANALAGPSVFVQRYGSLEILAGRATKASLTHSIRNDRPSDQLRGLAATLPALRGDVQSHENNHVGFVQLLLGKCSDVDQVALKDVGVLESEKEVLAQTVTMNAASLCQDDLVNLHTLLHSLSRAALQALAKLDGQEPHIRDRASALLYALDDRDSSSATLDEHTSLQPLSGIAEAVQYCQKGPGDDMNRLKAASSAWTSFASDCLMLYLPARAFDPALGPRLAREVHAYSVATLDQTRRLLKRMYAKCTGEHETMRSRLLQHDIVDLGPAPVVDSVCRPQISELAKLQVEFDSLYRFVLATKERQSDAHEPNTLSSVRANILQVRQRLVRQYHAYADLTVPVVGFIDCLRMGWQLHDRAQSLPVDAVDKFSIAKITPFVAANPTTWSVDQVVGALEQNASNHERLFVLSLLASRTTTVRDNATPRALREAVNQQFSWFYNQWQTQLSADQRTAAAKSSLYRYQGEEDSVEDESDEAIEELFPGEARSSHEEKQTPTASKLQDLAGPISDAHRAMFGGDASRASSYTHTLRSLRNIPSGAGPDIRSAMPTLLTMLHDMSPKTLDQAPAGPLYDIYTDCNIAEVKKVASLMSAIQRRFNELHTVWPEHATPVEVLRHCQQIFEAKHTEPLTKFFPLLEKLHGTVAEWQRIASREYSVTSLYDQLTDIIIHWRQLELSSWAGLLAREAAACVAGAKSWWFVAFETIIAATHAIRDSTVELEQHVRGLLVTLEPFIMGCGLGEYSPRLQILRDFEAHLASDAHDYPSIQRVRDALANFLCYFERFTPLVQDALDKGRAALEKDIRNVVHVASWKDRNIEILRQSAKSSHKKLLRYVCKFRILLARPVGPLIDSGIPQQDNQVELESAAPTTLLPATWSSTTVRVVQNAAAWKNRPTRYHNSAATAALVAAYVSKGVALCDAPQRVSSFLGELLSDIQELQKATPNLLTEDNKTLVQHLKTRKRRLLADVLKETRSMGFKANLSEDILAKQVSRAVVLARMPALPQRSDRSVVEQGELYFHQLLGIMPQIRVHSRKHSEDLTPAEAARCLTMIESMLDLIIQMRKMLAHQLEANTGLRRATRLMHSFAACARPLRASDSPEQRSDHLQNTVQWLETTIDLVKYQGKLASSDYSMVISTLQQFNNNLRAVCQEVALQPELPISMSDSTLESLFTRSKTILSDIKANIEQWARQHPELEPVLRHLRLWCTSSPLLEHYTNGVPHQTIDSWIPKLFSVLDQALGAVESIQSLKPVGRAAQDSSWLLQQTTLLQRQLQSMRAGQVSQSLLELLSQVHALPDETALQMAVESCQVQLPIAEAFNNGLDRLLAHYANNYTQISRMAFELAKSFSVIAQRGFCTPSEKSDSKEKDSGQVEAGTGLGDGEGAEDVSKDIKDDEDLSELAQSAAKQEDGGDIENEKDAVDMADEELEGELDEGEAKDEESEESDDQGQEEGGDMDEEAGNVDDLGPSTVDEKMWDEAKSEELRDKEGEGDNGKQKDEDLAAAEQDKKDTQDGDDHGESLDNAAAGDDEKEDVGREEMEKMDPHVQDQANLDLPEDLNMDADAPDADHMSDIDSINDDVESGNEQDTSGDEQALPNNEPDAGSVVDEDLGEDAEDTREAEQQPHAPDEENDDAQSDILMQDNVENDTNELDDNVVGESGTAPNEEPEGKDSTNAAAPQQGEQDEETGSAANEPDDGGTSGQGRKKGDQGGDRDEQQDQTQLPYKRIGDALEEWYKNHRPINAAQAEEPNKGQTQDQDVDMAEVEFQHLPNDNADADTQALGAATAEQSTALDEEKGLPVNEDLQADERPAMDDTEEPDEMADGDNQAGLRSTTDAAPRDAGHNAFVGETRPDGVDTDMDEGPERPEEDLDRLDDMDQQLSHTHLSAADDPQQISLEEARAVWSAHETSTRSLSLVLTEHLRLILQPTQATKMRGDFRTGKRLNIKRIIPYIASSYKRDKIWMRRSVPSKRAYQIMLAIDDSRSMAESNSRALAFETLTLVARALAMLEVGELSVVRFGATAEVAHAFNTPLTADAGAQIIKQFTFQQTKTDVRRLLAESIELFRAARLQAAGSASDLWQLQLIISDGVCEDHASIRQLVRQAHEERIMVVFVVVDMLASTPEQPPTTGRGSDEPVKQQSIVDLQTAEFVKDQASGEMQLKMVKYLDTFPFRYYLIVRDVQELPGVLAGALRQWFAEVVDTA